MLYVLLVVVGLIAFLLAWGMPGRVGDGLSHGALEADRGGEAWNKAVFVGVLVAVFFAYVLWLTAGGLPHGQA